MAQWKPVTSTPPPRANQNQRIDGVIYQISGQWSGSFPPPQYSALQAVTCSSAGSRPSPRYVTVNGYIIDVDSIWETLSDATKDLWEASFDLDVWALICYLQNNDRLPVTPEQAGK